MSKEKNKEPGGKKLDSDRRVRWVILFSLTILFSLILFPSLVITKHQYNLGDVAERDIKSPRDFFIEDQPATELNRQLAKEEVLTVYDYDAELGTKISLTVDEIFAQMRAASTAHNATSEPIPAAAENSAEETANAQKPSTNVITDKRQYLEEKLGIRVTRGAFSALSRIFKKNCRPYQPDTIKNSG
jgi:membrane-associated HD superfamily phosphohydrolase